MATEENFVQLAEVDRRISELSAARGPLIARQQEIERRMREIKQEKEEAAFAAARRGKYMSRRAWLKLGREQRRLQGEFTGLVAALAQNRIARQEMSNLRVKLDRQTFDPVFREIASKVLQPQVYKRIVSMTAEAIEERQAAL